MVIEEYLIFLMKFGTDYRYYGGNPCTISLSEHDLLENNTRGKSAELLAGDKATIIDFIDEMEFALIG